MSLVGSSKTIILKMRPGCHTLLKDFMLRRISVDFMQQFHLKGDVMAVLKPNCSGWNLLMVFNAH